MQPRHSDHVTVPVLSRALRVISMVALAVAPRALLAQNTGTNGPAGETARAASLPITLFGEVRSRSELDRPGDGVPADAFSYLRSRVGVRIDPAPRTRIVLLAQDSRVLGAETSNAATALANDVLELHQGYLELTAPWSTRSVAFRVGRQEIALGNERLVGAANWTNLGRSFDGARIVLAPSGTRPGAEPWNATAFAAILDERGRRFGSAPTATTTSADHVVAGLFGARRTTNGSSLEGTWLYDAGARYRTYDASDRTTVDARLRVPTLGAVPLRVELEGAYQVGHQTYRPSSGAASDAIGQSVRAWLAGLRIGTPAQSPRVTSVTFGADLLSGDATPTDGVYSSFSTLYGTNHPFYGLIDVIGDPATTTRERGLTDLFVSTTLPLTVEGSLRAELHRFEMRAGDDRSLGEEADVVAPFRLSSVTSLDVGYALFRASRGATAIGLGPTGSRRHWAYLQIGVAF